MTTIDSDALPAAGPNRPGIFAALWQAILQYRKRRALQRTLIQLSSYDARILRDMGIDPRDVAEAVHGRGHSLLFFEPLQRHDP